jgi:hypothetical protein
VAESDRSDRHEELGTMAGSEHTVSCENSGGAAPTSPHRDSDVNDEPRLVEDAQEMGSDTDDVTEDVMCGTDRVGHRELLNDVTGRKLRVFRKSPRPPARRSSSPAHDSE